MTKQNANAQATLIVQIMREELQDFAGIRNALIERAEELRYEDDTDYTDEEAAALIVKNINKYEGWLAFTVFYDDDENYWWRAGNDLIGVITDGLAMLEHYAECAAADKTVRPHWLQKNEEIEAELEFLSN